MQSEFKNYNKVKYTINIHNSITIKKKINTFEALLNKLLNL